MFNGKYTHLNEILERVHRDFGFEEVFADEAKEWIWDCLGYFGRDEILTCAAIAACACANSSINFYRDWETDRKSVV